MDAHDLTVARFNHKNAQTEKLLGLSQTPAGRGVAERYLEEYTTLVGQMLPLLKPLELRKQVEVLENMSIALVVISCSFDAISSAEQHLSGYYSSAGKALDFERFAYNMRTYDPETAEQVTMRAMRGRGSIKVRRAAARKLAKTMGLNLEMWSNSTRIKVGCWLHSVAISGPAFVDENGLPWLTDEAQSVAADVVAASLTASPVRIPSKVPVSPWVGPEKTVEGYPINFVRYHRKAGKRAVAAAFKDRSIYPTVEAINHIESVPYRVDQRIADLVEWAFNEDLGFTKLKKFPQRTDYPMPEKPAPWEEMTELQRRQWKKDASKAKRKNNGLKSQMNKLVFLLQVARWLGNDEFYLPASLDFRGRVYSLSEFNFHGAKHIRAMFRFARGKALGERGLYWLKVHCANSYGIDKVPFDERVAWTDANRDLIQWSAADPIGDQRWLDADDPFMFMAACLELDAAWMSGNPEGFVSTLPVSFDGSCNGLQHFAAITRDSFTAYHVNLVPRDRPGDIYKVVADAMAVEARKDTSEIAAVCLPHINRSLVKRNVMTFGYSSPRGGMVNQHREDTMEPEQDKCIRDPSRKHPFSVTGATGDDGGEAAAQYLGGLAYKTITGLLDKPSATMKFLRGVAGKLADQGKPVVWHTPLGFPVVHVCTEFAASQTTLFLYDKGVKRRIQPREAVETNTINKNDAKKGIAPNFVHSMDACHLQMVVLACKDEGINDLALVHDSYGCLAADADNVRSILKEQFYTLYHGRNVLLDFLREACEQMDTKWHTLDNPPPLGDYDISEVLNAEYAFA